MLRLGGRALQLEKARGRALRRGEGYKNEGRGGGTRNPILGKSRKLQLISKLRLLSTEITVDKL